MPLTDLLPNSFERLDTAAEKVETGRAPQRRGARQSETAAGARDLSGRNCSPFRRDLRFDRFRCPCSREKEQAE